MKNKKKVVSQILGKQYTYPLVNQYNCGKSPCLMGKTTINGHVQSLFVSLPEGTLFPSIPYVSPRIAPGQEPPVPRRFQWTGGPVGRWLSHLAKIWENVSFTWKKRGEMAGFFWFFQS
jgi:hypothetical protein